MSRPSRGRSGPLPDSVCSSGKVCPLVRTAKLCSSSGTSGWHHFNFFSWFLITILLLYFPGFWVLELSRNKFSSPFRPRKLIKKLLEHAWRIFNGSGFCRPLHGKNHVRYKMSKRNRLYVLQNYLITIMWNNMACEIEDSLHAIVVCEKQNGVPGPKSLLCDLCCGYPCGSALHETVTQNYSLSSGYHLQGITKWLSTD